ncbi:MAG: hypothetical protein BMS9Abin37_0531 [Acidobacteriota bacterium]|nr:MAG: hypothetical protein BMS9Abin37_0531 [Acidobacteriota bacterium]
MSRGAGELGIRVLLSAAVLMGLVTSCGRRDAPNLSRRYCADCHGVEGGGDGRFAEEFQIPPTDFRRGNYKFKQTASGEPPTDRDIVATLEQGARGTGMIPQLQLSESERADMAAYLRNLADEAPRGESRRLSLAPRPAVLDPELGRLWYVKAGCDRCHGAGGQGDGEAAPTLETSDGRPVAMPNLTRVPYRRGENTEAIAWAILAGRDGTPMPSYEGALTAEQLWGLAFFVKTMQSETRPGGMMGLVGEEASATRTDMEAFHAWRGMGGMGGMRRRRRRE